MTTFKLKIRGTLVMSFEKEIQVDEDSAQDIVRRIDRNGVVKSEEDYQHIIHTLGLRGVNADGQDVTGMVDLDIKAITERSIDLKDRTGIKGQLQSA